MCININPVLTDLVWVPLATLSSQVCKNSSNANNKFIYCPHKGLHVEIHHDGEESINRSRSYSYLGLLSHFPLRIQQCVTVRWNGCPRYLCAPLMPSVGMAALVTFMYLSCLTELAFPLEHYTLELQDQRVAHNVSLVGEVALLDQKAALVTAVQPGQTNLILVHKSILLFRF